MHVVCSKSEVKRSLAKIYLMLGLSMVVFAGGIVIALNAIETLVGSYISARYTNSLKFRHCYTVVRPISYVHYRST